MSSSYDYAHHNEEQDIVWWHEEGKHTLKDNTKLDRT